MAVIPTLEKMAEVYRLDRTGGAESELFRTYVSWCDRLPIHLYNPMTSKPEAPDTVDRLLAIDAESIVGELSGDRALSVAVLTPGAWTHRGFDDVGHRVRALPVVTFWAGDPVDGDIVRQRTIEQIARLEWQERHGAAESVAALTEQEGRALRDSGRTVSGDAERAADVYHVVADEVDMGTLIAWIFGDEAAEQLGYRGLGLAEGDGLAFARQFTVRPA